MRFDGYLTEATLDISQQDIDMLYDPISKYRNLINRAIKVKSSAVIMNVIEKIMMLPDIEIEGITISYIKKFTSKNLKSPLCRIAHAINPVEIYVGFTTGTIFYSPLKGVIFIGIPFELFFDLIKQENFKRYEEDFLNIFQNITSEIVTKSFMRHELTHWMDDSLRSRHMTKKIKIGKEATTLKVEIEAVIHQVLELKRSLGPRFNWEDLTWDQFLNLLPDIKMNISNIDGFLKLLLKRMHREKLLTTRMKSTIRRPK